MGLYKVKRAITTSAILNYCDVKKDVKLTVNASCHFMDTCLMQANKSVAYATRAFIKSY